MIGEGGMGVVLKAFEPALQRLLAIKVLSAAVAGSVSARRRFTREAQSAAAVCHEHIVAVYGVHETDGLPYLVMQYVAGESLQARLDRSGPLQVEEVVRIGLQTAMGLAAAHARGLIHRDIKPANILLEGEPGALATGVTRVKITDFGLARMVDDVGLTQNGVVAGTPEYMAPEQARGETVDHRADLFSLGSVLYALCTGVSPFGGTTAVAVIHKVSEQEPAPLRSLNPAVPAWLEGFIARLLAKNPADRFQTTSEVVALLEGFLAHLRQPATIAAPELPPALLPVSPRSPGAQEHGRWRQQFTKLFAWPAGLIVPCAAAVLAMGIFYWFAGVGDPAPKENGREVHLPLRGIPEDRDGVERFGPDAKKCVKFEPEGLRITLPAGFPGERSNTGVRIPMSGRGDFEVTIHYEILTEPQQANAGQRNTRLTIQAQLDRKDWTAATVARRISSDKGTQFTTWTMRDNFDNSGNRQMKARQHPAQAKIGRLRIVRIGSDASFFAAEGPDADFTLLPPPRHLGDEDLKYIELVGATGGPKATLDVRFTDLRVHTSTGLAPPPSQGQARRSTRIALPIAAALFSVLALGAWLLLRRGRPDQATNSEPMAPIAIRCPGCAKGLKARAELAGKKLKCPGCGHAIRVPETRPSVPRPGLAFVTLVLCRHRQRAGRADHADAAFQQGRTRRTGIGSVGPPLCVCCLRQEPPDQAEAHRQDGQVSLVRPGADRSGSPATCCDSGPGLADTPPCRTRPEPRRCCLCHLCQPLVRGQEQGQLSLLSPLLARCQRQLELGPGRRVFQHRPGAGGRAWLRRSVRRPDRPNGVAAADPACLPGQSALAVGRQSPFRHHGGCLPERRGPHRDRAAGPDPGSADHRARQRRPGDADLPPGHAVPVQPMVPAYTRWLAGPALPGLAAGRPVLGAAAASGAVGRILEPSLRGVGIVRRPVRQVSPVAGFSWALLSMLVGLRQRAWSRLALALLVAGLTLAPWTIRNYLVLGRLVPLKSNLAFEAYQSQCLQPDGLLQDFKGHPGRANKPEGREYRALGEMAYLERKREQFWQAVRADPVEFLDRSASRVLAATVWYVPFNRDHEAKQPWILWLGRLTHPLPFLALLVLLLTTGSKPVHGTGWLVMGLYVFHLLPYVLVSYYERVCGPTAGSESVAGRLGDGSVAGLVVHGHPEQRSGIRPAGLITVSWLCPSGLAGSEGRAAAGWFDLARWT